MDAQLSVVGASPPPHEYLSAGALLNLWESKVPGSWAPPSVPGGPQVRGGSARPQQSLEPTPSPTHKHK